MKTKRNKERPGLIYTTAIQYSKPFKRQNQTHSQRRERAGSITGLTPKRNQSVGKIIMRSCTPKKKLSIQIQTSQLIPIMENKATQVEILLEDKADFAFDCSSKYNKNRTGVLRMADFNALTEQANILTKTIKKKYENFYTRQNKQNLVTKQRIENQKLLKTNQNTEESQMPTKVLLIPASLSKPQLGKQEIRPVSKLTEKGSREQKISKLSALYQKNLARYETSKGVLGDLLKQNKGKP